MFFFTDEEDHCFDLAFNYVYRLGRNVYDNDAVDLEVLKFFEDLSDLAVDLEVLRFFVSYVRQAKSNGFFADNDEEDDIGTGGNNNPHIILPIIEDFVSKIPHHLNSAYRTSGSDGALIEVKRCREYLTYFGTVINQMCTSLLANKGCRSLGHHQRLVDLFHSLSRCLDVLCVARPEIGGVSNHNTLIVTAKFIESFIGFATAQGVDRMPLIPLLTQLQVTFANAACTIHTAWFDRDRYDGGQELEKKLFVGIVQMLQKIMLLPHLREFYISILTAFKLSKASTHIFSRQKKKKEQEQLLPRLPQWLRQLPSELELRPRLRSNTEPQRRLSLLKRYLLQPLRRLGLLRRRQQLPQPLRWQPPQQPLPMQMQPLRLQLQPLLQQLRRQEQKQELEPEQEQELELELELLRQGLQRHGQKEEEEHGLEVAKNFIHLLLYNLTELLQSYTSIVFSVFDQLQKLHQGVRFLSILLVEKHKQFIALDDEVKDLIGAVVIDAGILICSLSLDELKESSAKESDIALDELKEGLANESDLALSHCLRVLEFIMSEVVQIHPPASSSFSSSSFSKTNELGYLDFLSLLQHLEELVNTENDSIALLKDQFHTVKNDLASLEPFLKNMAEQCYQNNKFQTLRDSVMEIAHKTEFAIDSIIYQVNDKPDCIPMSLGTITEEINSLKTEVLDSLRNTDISDQIITRTSIHTPSRVSASAPKFNEVLVGLHEEQNTIIHKLTRGSRRLDIVSIVGMPGLGKTTLANKVYNHPSITSYFYFRAWCTVSQEYTKHGLLLQIMGDVVSKNPDKYHKMKEDDLAEELRRHLMRNRYLIVLDDVWQVNAFDLLQQSFPNDRNGSRLLITSRYHNLCSRFEDYELRQLNNQESSELLQNKIFGSKGCCPPELYILSRIARRCKGLPLTIVLVAGVLKNSEHNRWEDIANGLSTSMEIQEQCTETLELSYQNLPDYLKPCLLYFGAFQENQDIVVQSLLSLWISEGFVQYNEAKSLEEGAKSLEDMAEEYLTNLIGRSLVMVAKQRSIGGAKTCRIHVLLHEFCVRKAQKQSFLQISHGWNDLFASTTLYNLRRLSIHCKEIAEVEEQSIFFPHLRSLLLFFDKSLRVLHYSVLFKNFKLLRVLNVRDKYAFTSAFPEEIELLIHLRYLALPYISKSIPSGIANLTRLETFLIKTSLLLDDGIKLPNNIWYMKKLRHLYCSSGFIFPTDNLEGAPDLPNLKTCTLCTESSSESLHHIIKKLPNIRRLRCMRPRGKPIIENFQGLDNLKRLESLRMHGFLTPEFGLSFHLKKLTLAFCNKQWSEISPIGKLPNLEVLKLLKDSFVEETWKVREEKFPKLKFLKLESLDIRKWTFASSADDNFPCLEKLVLHNCPLLEDISSCLGDIQTIEMIEVKNCGRYAMDFVKKIQKEQKEAGNERIEIKISSSETPPSSSETYYSIGFDYESLSDLYEYNVENNSSAIRYTEMELAS